MSIRFSADILLPDQGDNIIRTKDPIINPNPKGYGHELFIHMKKYRDRVAQIYAESGETDTFNALLERCTRVALHLRKRGIGPGDIISPCTSNHFNSTVAMVAPLMVGAKIACLDPFTSEGDIKVMTDMVKPKLLFVCENALEKIDKIVKELNLETEIVVFGETNKYTPFEELLRPFSEDEEENFEPYEAKDLFETIVIVFSSGSTGAPKGICLSHYCILCQLGRLGGTRLFRDSSILYSTVVWISTQLAIAMRIICGTARLISPQFTVERTWKYLIKYNVSYLCLSPNDTMTILKHGNPDKVQTPNLKALLVFGGKISLESVRAVQKIFSHPILVFAPYGQSEVFGSIFGFDLQQFMRKPDHAGTPTSGFWYKIVDPETGKVCGPNETGELCIKTMFCMSGYYQQDSSDLFDSDGFLKTGDIAYYDEELCFFIVERLREALKYKSYWIAPTVLENILYQHPGVKTACVIGLPSEVGDVATAVVVKSDLRKDLNEEVLVKFVNDKVDDIKRIRGGVIFVNDSEIPYTPSGKIKRFALRKYILEKLGDFNIHIKPE